MGHVISRITEPEKCNRGLVMAAIAERAERDGDSGYYGPMHWHDEVSPLKNREEAEKWIRAHDKGFYDDHAVRYYDYSRLKDTKKITELKAKAAALAKEKAEYIAKHSVKNLKANLITCPVCGSKLSRERLRTESCPLCYTDLRSKTTLDGIKRYEERTANVWKQVQVEQQKGKGEIRWLIKYEYHG